MAVCERVLLARLPLLASPDYVPHTFDYANTSGLGVSYEQWLAIFRESVPSFQKYCSADNSVPSHLRQARADEFGSRFRAILDVVATDPTAELEGFGSAPPTCLRLCKIRDECLRQAGFQDIYKAVKADKQRDAVQDQENAAALGLLRATLDELDAIADDNERMESVLRGVFAGNIFDLGAAASAALYEQGDSSGGFARAKANLVPRPWAVDCLDSMLQRLSSARKPYKQALVFADNAGSDIVLGMLPFLRELIKRGTRIVLALNEVPSLNDVTWYEMRDIAARAAAIDGLLASALASGMLKIVSSGSDLPVIDLRQVSTDVVDAASDTDLVILEGMGRAIETNLHAEFTCDSFKLGMIKHPEVATLLGGRLYDCVCKFQRGAAIAASCD